MRHDKFPKVNDVMLAEALRQIIPAAGDGVIAKKSGSYIQAFRRAELVLAMWVKQERGREKQLGGPLPSSPKFSLKFIQDGRDAGQTIPAECLRARVKTPRSVRDDQVFF